MAEAELAELPKVRYMCLGCRSPLYSNDIAYRRTYGFLGYLAHKKQRPPRTLP